MPPSEALNEIRNNLKALRKARNLTQADLGRQLGVKQPRIAEIEANPGTVSLEQFLALLSALGAKMTLKEESSQDTHSTDALNQPERSSIRHG